MKLTYLYVKRLPNGLFYLGKTESKNPHKYIGSGTKWLVEIEKNQYSHKDIETWILHKTTNKEDLIDMALYYSRIFNVKESKAWANIKDEEGDGGNTVGGTIVVRKNKQTKHILKHELDQYIQKGWTKSGHTKGLIIINKENKEKRINKEDLQNYINSGWELGRVKKSIPKLKNTIWVNNRKLEKRIPIDNLEQYLINLWEIGRINTVGEKVSTSQKGTKKSDSTKNNMKKAWTDTRKNNQANRIKGENNPSKNESVILKQVESRRLFYEKNPNRLKQISDKNCKKIVQTDKSGNFIKEWESIKSICEELNIDRNAINYAKRTGKMLEGSMWKNKNT
jgi:hypothetical protein